MEKENKGALYGLKILDLTRVLAGPYSTMILADMGADVLKIEIPKFGDDTRNYPPFVNGESLYYANINRSKKSITLNLKSEEGKKMFLELVKKADVVVENFRPGVMDRLGIGYDIINEINDQIIYAAVSGFGSYGPYSSRPGYDIIAQAMGGLMSISGWPDTGPTRSGNAMGDVLGGLNLTIGILAALRARDTFGKGQRVDVSLVDSVVASLEIGLQRYYHEGKPPERTGNRYTTIYPYDSFEAMDGSFVIGCGNESLWEKLCIAMGKPELLEDERFITGENRNMKWKELKGVINDWAKNYTIDEIVTTILDAGVPSAPIYDFDNLVNDIHIADAREMFVAVEHPKIGKMNVGGCAIKLMGTKNQVRWASPELGEHNKEVYVSELGLSEDDIVKLKESGVI